MTMERYTAAGGVAVITGGAQGIGAAVAERLARAGSSVALVDRDAQALSSTADRLRRIAGPERITMHVVDVTDSSAPQQVLGAAAEAHGPVTLLVNNAGIVLAGRVDQVTIQEIDRVLDVNLRASIAWSHAAVQHLPSGGHIAALSSLFGILAPYGQAAYAASKFGVRGFHEALRQELIQRGIGVTVVHPGGIKTSIARAAIRGSGVSDREWNAMVAAFDRYLVTSPEQAAGQIVSGIQRRRARVLIGPDARVGDILVRLAPTTYPGLWRRFTAWSARR